VKNIFLIKHYQKIAGKRSIGLKAIHQNDFDNQIVTRNKNQISCLKGT